MYYIREDEEQRYGRNKPTQINHAYINSGEYRRKFDNLTDSKVINKLIYKNAKEMLFHRSGTMFEDMCWVSPTEEKVVYRKMDETRQRMIRVDDSIAKILSKYSDLIPIHTHPSTFPPSPDDFNCLLNAGYKFGIIICHDGKIFTYSSFRHVDFRLWDVYMSDLKANGYDEYDAQIEALKIFRAANDIIFKEV